MANINYILKAFSPEQIAILNAIINKEDTPILDNAQLIDLQLSINRAHQHISSFTPIKKEITSQKIIIDT